MTLAVSGYICQLSGGFWALEGDGAPATPTLAVVNDGDGAAVTAIVTGAAGATHQLYYRRAGTSAWTTGETRVGDGDISQGGLTAASYFFIVQSLLAGYLSAPSACQVLVVSDTSSAGAGTLREVIREDVAGLFLNNDDFSESVGWKTATGTISIVANVVREDDERMDGEDGLYIARWATVTIALEDVADPAKSDPVTGLPAIVIDGVDWNIVSALTPGFGESILRIYRREPVEKSSEGRRKAR